MPIQYQDKKLAFNIRTFEDDKYVINSTLIYEDIINSTITINGDTSEIEMTLKVRDEYNKFMTPDVLNLLERVVTDQKNNTYSMFFVVTDVQIKLNTSGSYEFLLYGLDIQGIKEKKLVGTTTNVITNDPDNLPNNFYKYKDNDTFDNIILNLYENVFLNPQTLAYGQLLGVDNDRKIKGLTTINNEAQSNVVKDIQHDANNTFLEVESDILELFELRNRSEFKLVNDELTIQIYKPKTVNINLLSNPDELKSFNFLIQKKSDFSNLFHATANPNIYATEKNVTSGEITTFETSEDVSFIAGDNQTYTNNQATSGLKKNNKSLNFDIELNFNTLTSFIDYNINDIIKIQGIRFADGDYIIKEITENIDVSGVNYMVKLDKTT